jgi:hypothetical protein
VGLSPSSEPTPGRIRIGGYVGYVGTPPPRTPAHPAQAEDHPPGGGVPLHPLHPKPPGRTTADWP